MNENIGNLERQLVFSTARESMLSEQIYYLQEELVEKEKALTATLQIMQECRDELESEGYEFSDSLQSIVPIK